VVGTAVVINVRMVMYSASIAPHFADYGRRLRAGLAYVLTDQAYALSVAEFERNPERSRWRYYLGAAATLWVVWQIATVVGVVVGASVPDAWGLTFAVPGVPRAPRSRDEGPADHRRGRCRRYHRGRRRRAPPESRPAHGAVSGILVVGLLTEVFGE